MILGEEAVCKNCKRRIYFVDGYFKVWYHSLTAKPQCPSDTFAEPEENNDST